MSLRIRPFLLVAAASMSTLLAPSSIAQVARPDSAALVAEQREAMERVAWMDGIWRGTVTSSTPGGEVTLTQTERVGTMADGTVRLVEGRGFVEDGSLEFNAVGMIAFDARADEYVMTTSARGMTSRPWFRPTPEGFEWGFEAGPAKIRYVAVHANGVWTEEGFMAVEGQAERKFLTMRLQRLGDTDWPNAGAVPSEE